MKILSEITGKEYPSIEACKKEEEQFKKEQSSKQLREQSEKKELATQIDEADLKLTEANKLYDVARNKARGIIEQAKKEANQIIEVAEKNLREAEERKLDAVVNFNKKYGAYKTTYTGEKAAEEFNRAMRIFNDDPIIRFFNRLGF